MVKFGTYICPKCGGALFYYDHVKRIVRGKFGVKRYLDLARLRCEKCRSVHRAIPDNIFPYKQYEAEIIKGVIDGFILPTTLGFEDYPCEMTMTRWRIFYMLYSEN